MIYPYTVYLCETDDTTYWVAKSPMLKGCIGQGSSQQEAVEELEENEKEWLRVAKEEGIFIPEIRAIDEKTYSGRVTLRLSPYEHMIAANNAKKERISLNQYLCDAVAEYNARVAW